MIKRICKQLISLEFRDLFKYKIPYFLENLWKFKEELWWYRSWDSAHLMSFMSAICYDMADLQKKHGSSVNHMKYHTELTRVGYMLGRLATGKAENYCIDMERYPKEVWHCQCRENKKIAYDFISEECRGMIFYKMEIRDCENGRFTACTHNYRHGRKLEPECVNWVFDEMKKKILTWWD